MSEAAGPATRGERRWGQGVRHTPSMMAALALLIGVSACRELLGGREHALGDVIWRHPINTEYPWHGVPAVADGRVFVDVNDRIVALGVSDGRQLWSTAVRDSQFPLARNMLVQDGTVFASGGLEVIALRAETGAIRWRVVPDGTEIFARSAVDDRALYVGTKGRLVAALRLTDGRRLWAVDIGPRWPLGAVMGIAAGGDTLFVTATKRFSLDHMLLGVAVVALDRRDGRELWRYESAEPDHAVHTEPLLTRDLVLFSDVAAPGFVALDRSTGEPRWQLTTDRSYRGPYGPPVVIGSAMYGGSGDARVYAARLRDGAPLWRAEVGTTVDKTAACNGRIVVERVGLAFLDLAGRVLRKVLVDEAEFITSGIAVAGDRVIVSGTKAIYAIAC